MGIFAAVAGWFAGVRSMENPSNPLDPWHGGGDGGEEDGLTRDRALKVAAVWRAMGLIARSVAKLPVGVYRRLAPGQELDLWHPAGWVLRRRPNDAMTPYVFKEVIQSHVLTEGNGYAYIQRDGAARPVELWPLNPERTYPVRENGRLWYVHELSSGELRKLPPADMLHVKGLGFDGLVGYRVLDVAADAIGLASNAQRYGKIYFKNSARPNMVLTHPGRLSDQAKKNLRESWERMHRGIEESHKTAILEDGMGIKELTINARDSQLIESKQFSLVDIANIFHVPPHKLGSTVNVSYASLEQENQSFLDDTIDPWLIGWEEELEAKLLTEVQLTRESHFIAFDRKAMLRSDSSARGSFYASALNAGWMNRDEVRLIEGLNPIPGGAGQVFYAPAGQQALGQSPPQTTPGPVAVTPDNTRGQVLELVNATRSVLVETLARMAGRIHHHAKRASTTPTKFLAWVDTIETDHGSIVREAISGPLTAYLAAVRQSGGVVPAEGRLASRLFEVAKSHYLELSGQATARNLARVVEAGEPDFSFLIDEEAGNETGMA